MLPISGFDHVAITVAKLGDACDFYAEIIGARVILEHAVDGDTSLRQVVIGEAMLSIHQHGNGVHPAARTPHRGRRRHLPAVHAPPTPRVRRPDRVGGASSISGAPGDHIGDALPRRSVTIGRVRLVGVSERDTQ